MHACMCVCVCVSAHIDVECLYGTFPDSSSLNPASSFHINSNASSIYVTDFVQMHASSMYVTGIVQMRQIQETTHSPRVLHTKLTSYRSLVDVPIHAQICVLIHMCMGMRADLITLEHKQSRRGCILCGFFKNLYVYVCMYV
jgi:hypothetical protein